MITQQLPTPPLQETQPIPTPPTPESTQEPAAIVTQEQSDPEQSDPNQTDPLELVAASDDAASLASDDTDETIDDAEISRALEEVSEFFKSVAEAHAITRTWPTRVKRVRAVRDFVDALEGLAPPAAHLRTMHAEAHGASASGSAKRARR
jgi:hypothetical protein